MAFVERTLALQRACVVVAVCGSALAFWRKAFDTFNTPKLTVVALALLAGVVIAGVRVLRTRRMLVPTGAIAIAAVALATALLVATVISPTRMLSVVGRAGRHTGLVAYGGGLLLWLLTWRAFRERGPAPLVHAVIATAIPIAAYGLYQASGRDVFQWGGEAGVPVFSTFGNSNFYSAWLAVAAVAAVGTLLSRSDTVPWRIVGGLAVVMTVPAVVTSQSAQGSAAFAAGVGGLLVAGLWTSAQRLGRRAAILLMALGLAAGIAIAARAGPFARVRAEVEQGVATRVDNWQAALAMAADRPLVGYGLTNYSDWSFTYRPAWAATQVGLGLNTDTPHSVPLDMLASGGGLLLAAWLGFVVLTATVGVRALRRTADPWSVAGLLGAWVAWQVQSFVSIDVPPLSILHFALAGALVAASGNAPRELVLPGAVTLSAADRRRGREGFAAWRPLPVAALAVPAVVALPLVVLPFRSDVATQDARAAAARQDVDAAAAAYERAAKLAPWEPRPPTLAGSFYASVGRDVEALEAFQEALDREPRGLAHALNIGRLAGELGQPDVAGAAYERAVEIDPTTPAVLLEVAQFRINHGNAQGALALVERAAETDPTQAATWVALGTTRAAAGDVQGARSAYERALSIDPAAPGAAEGLASLA